MKPLGPNPGSPNPKPGLGEPKGAAVFCARVSLPGLRALLEPANADPQDPHPRPHLTWKAETPPPAWHQHRARAPPCLLLNGRFLQLGEARKGEKSCED